MTDDLKKEKWAIVEWPKIFVRYQELGEGIGILDAKDRPATQIKEFTDDGFAYFEEPVKANAVKKRRGKPAPRVYGPPLPPGYDVDAFGEMTAHHSELLVRLGSDEEFPRYDTPTLITLIWLGLIVGAPIVFLILATRLTGGECFRIDNELKALRERYDESKADLEGELTSKIAKLRMDAASKDVEIKGLKERIEMLVKTTADGSTPHLTGPAVGSQAPVPTGAATGVDLSPAKPSIKAPGALGSEFL